METQQLYTNISGNLPTLKLKKTLLIQTNTNYIWFQVSQQSQTT